MHPHSWSRLERLQAAYGANRYTQEVEGRRLSPKPQGTSTQAELREVLPRPGDAETTAESGGACSVCVAVAQLQNPLPASLKGCPFAISLQLELILKQRMIQIVVLEVVPIVEVRLSPIQPPKFSRRTRRLSHSCHDQAVLDN